MGDGMYGWDISVDVWVVGCIWAFNEPERITHVPVEGSGLGSTLVRWPDYVASSVAYETDCIKNCESLEVCIACFICLLPCRMGMLG